VLPAPPQCTESPIGNPPFGDEVEEGDEDHLGANTLESFEVAAGRTAVDSEHVILERSIKFLDGGGRLGMVLPDGVLNNQGDRSNCPQVRRMLARHGFIEAIVSLPDYAFRKSGAQNKTSILFFRRFSEAEQRRFDERHEAAMAGGMGAADAIAAAWAGSPHRVFLAEANYVGYAPTGAPTQRNDLYNGQSGGRLAEDQANTILGEFRRFNADPAAYEGRTSPDTMAIPFHELWLAHPSHRLDPKYYLFKREEHSTAPAGWVRLPVSQVMRRRENQVYPALAPEQLVKVMTIAQTGEIRSREAGKGRNPPEWLGMYFDESPSRWFAARANDVVFSSIDLWKGCIAVVPPEFDGALVTLEFPIYEVVDERLDPEFVSYLMRSRYYQRAFRAITTGHSNRRRTQEADFEGLEIAFPVSRTEQQELIAEIRNARANQRTAAAELRERFLVFSDHIDGRGGEELPEIEPDGEVDAPPSDS
jgi:type I restriction enzyme M protein